MAHAPVLIVSAGPTGLILALSLARRGEPFRLISEDEGPGEHSRAMAVQARTLEFYDQFGFADEVIRQGIPADRAHLRQAGENGPSRDRPQPVSVSAGLSPGRPRTLFDRQAERGGRQHRMAFPAHGIYSGCTQGTRHGFARRTHRGVEAE
jgi:2-polyprenyl-6-methoxyphenol hydroxylase-like FAD-dependent oxidoreductase